MRKDFDEDDEDEDDGFVTIGTSLPLYDDDEVLVRKPLAVQDQRVRDAQGRIRFHGAFTGGFSAGYFNTVDTKEGWAPKSFKSTRSDRSENSTNQKPEDFMDEEDFSEYGIAPKMVATTKNFANSESNHKRKAATYEEVSGTGDLLLIGSTSLLQDLIIPCRSSVGLRLLKKLGWREGQGVGPRVKKRQKKHHDDVKKNEELIKSKNRTNEKLYGCSLPPQSSFGTRNEEIDEELSDDDEYLVGVTFAPCDVCPINFDPKDNVHGLGYHGIDPSTALLHGIEFKSTPVTLKGKQQGICGQAFGVGAFEEDDDDIYGVESMSNYDRELRGEEEEKKSKNTHGWTAPKFSHNSFKNLELTQMKTISGFHLCSTPPKRKQMYPAPQIPRGFEAVHRFESASPLLLTQTDHNSDEKSKNLNAFTRGTLLGEKPHLNSVYELVSPEDKAKIEAVKMSIDLKSRQETTKFVESPVNTTKNESSSNNDTPSTSRWTTPAQPSHESSSSTFLPFAKDEAKQKRYEAYLDAVKHKKQYIRDEKSCVDLMTEWEKEREKEEFSKAVHLFQPLSFMIASRFIRAQHDDDEQNVKMMNVDTMKSEKTKAVEMKMFGKLTREKYKWHPDKIVCKRFNIADPYPESTVVGLPGLKRDKLSVFNFLNFASEENQKDNNTMKEEESQPIQEDSSESKPMKPLAILATVDLRPKRAIVQTGNVTNLDNKTNTFSCTASLEQQPSSSEQQPSSMKNEDENERPPIDLFKAIFEDSDSSETSTDESENTSNAATMTKTTTTIITASSTTTTPTITINKMAESSTSAINCNMESVENSKFLKETNDVDESELKKRIFKLPFHQNIAEKKKTRKEKKKRKHSMSKESEKHSKSQHKHKKLKHKSRKKKKKNKESDGSEADYDTGSESPSEIDKCLLSKLQGYVEWKEKGT